MIFWEAQAIFKTARSKERGKPLERNTRLLKSFNGTDYDIVLHQTAIITLHSDGSLTIRNGGWDTVTTRARLRTYLPYGLTVYRAKGKTYVYDRNGDKIEFYSGMRFNSLGEYIQGSVPAYMEDERSEAA